MPYSSNEDLPKAVKMIIMPYSSNEDLPKAVRDSLPDEAQSIWRKIADSAIAEYGDEKKAFATAWAGLRRAGWDKVKGKWSKVEKESPTSGSVHVNRPLGEKDDTDNSVGNVSMGYDEKLKRLKQRRDPDNIEGSEVKKEFTFKIAKADVEKRLAFGWSAISRDKAGNEVWDLQNDSIDPEDLEALAYKYVRFYRDSGELHNGSHGKAVLVESVVTTLEKQQVWGIPSGVMPVGWWVGFYVLDDEVWEKVKNGEYQAFSIEGNAVREKV